MAARPHRSSHQPQGTGRRRAQYGPAHSSARGRSLVHAARGDRPACDSARRLERSRGCGPRAAGGHRAGRHPASGPRPATRGAWTGDREPGRHRCPGARLGCIASQALGLTLITATGDTLVLTRSHDGARFLAAAVSLGCLGVISQVRLKVRAAYRLRDVRRTVPLDECLARIDATAAAHRHFEFFWFPYSDLALTKTL